MPASLSLVQPELRANDFLDTTWSYIGGPQGERELLTADDGTNFFAVRAYTHEPSTTADLLGALGLQGSFRKTPEFPARKAHDATIDSLRLLEENLPKLVSRREYLRSLRAIRREAVAELERRCKQDATILTEHVTAQGNLYVAYGQGRNHEAGRSETKFYVAKLCGIEPTYVWGDKEGFQPQAVVADTMGNVGASPRSLGAVIGLYEMQTVKGDSPSGTLDSK